MSIRFDDSYESRLNKDLFLKFNRLINSKTGIVFDLSKVNFLERKLGRRMEQLGIKSFLKYYFLLVSDLEEREWKNLYSEITVQETAFFRINPHFYALEEYVIPEIIKNFRWKKHKHLSVLSAGCSTGEEVYSVIFSVFKEKTLLFDWDITVCGVDLSEKAIRKAREGFYDEREVKDLPEHVISKFFEKRDGGFEVKPFFKNMAAFSSGNLLKAEDLRSFGFFDVVFCRYVLIYLDEKSKQKVLENIFKVMNPGGFLFVAPSEVYNVPSKFEKIVYKDTMFFRKPV